MNYLNKVLLDDTIVASATPDAVSAISIIRLSGKDCINYTSKHFTGKNLNEQKTQTIHFGKFIDQQGKILDEVLISIFRAPHSYTGEDIIEISCHGSPYIVRKIQETLIQSGCRAARPGEFTFRAFIHGKLDLSQAEAVSELISSQNEAGHEIAFSQLKGGISSELKILKKQLVEFTSLIELELDFSEEDVEFANREDMKKRLQMMHAHLSQLIQSYAFGNSIKNGVPTVIAGKPNAGKSTLLNALINEERSIVSEIAGTTRDTIEESFFIHGFEFRLIDTAGIRNHTSDQIEQEGINRTLDKIQKAGIVLYVFDVTQTNTENVFQELQQIEIREQTLLIPIANKMDLLQENERENWKGKGIPNLIAISSKNREGLDEIRNQLFTFVSAHKSEGVNITSLRHFEALNRCLDAVKSVQNGIIHKVNSELLAIDLKQAIFEIGEITGEITSDDILTHIFSNFCIGK